MLLLVIEDDEQLSAALTQILEENGHQVDVVADGETGLEYGKSRRYDTIILDLMLPKMSGTDVAAELRRAKVSTPILILTARDSVADKIAGLDSGADDYMTKPFSPAELLAHLRALSRRKGDVVFETIEAGNLVLNLDTGDASCGDKSIHLSYKELQIAKLLMTNPGQVISKQTMMERVWGADATVADNNVEAFISFLRKKLQHLGSTVRIETLRKFGYRAVVEE